MTYSDEDLDFKKTFDIYWRGKYILFTFIFTSFILGIIYISSQEKEYSSKINIIINQSPPSLSATSDKQYNIVDRKIIYDFKNFFYNEEFFNQWKNSTKSNIDFDEFRNFENYKNTNFKKENSTVSFDFFYNSDYLRSESAIIINSNQKDIIAEYLDYFKYISKHMTNEFILKTQLIQKDIIKYENIIPELAISVNDFIENANETNPILIFDDPTLPIKVYPSSTKFMIIFLFFGSFCGVVFVTFKEMLKK